MTEQYDWRKEVVPESRVVLKASCMTGEVLTVHEWGVQVWNIDRGRERENWSWQMITIRRPRLIKRYPRPFRFPRKEPTDLCHCRIGKMAVIVSKEVAVAVITEVSDVPSPSPPPETPPRITFEVQCTRCKRFIGTESFPNRIRNAYKLVRKASLELIREISSSPRVERPPKPKATRGSKGPKQTNRKTKKVPRRLGVRPSRRRKKEVGVGKTTKTKGHPKVPKRNEVPSPQNSREDSNAVPSSSRKEKEVKSDFGVLADFIMTGKATQQEAPKPEKPKKPAVEGAADKDVQHSSSSSKIPETDKVDK